MYFLIISIKTLLFTLHAKLQCFRASIHATTRDVRTGMIRRDERYLTIRLLPQEWTVHAYVRYTDGDNSLQKGKTWRIRSPSWI